MKFQKRNVVNFRKNGKIIVLQQLYGNNPALNFFFNLVTQLQVTTDYTVVTTRILDLSDSKLFLL